MIRNEKKKTAPVTIPLSSQTNNKNQAHFNFLPLNANEQQPAPQHSCTRPIQLNHQSKIHFKNTNNHNHKNGTAKTVHQMQNDVKKSKQYL